MKLRGLLIAAVLLAAGASARADQPVPGRWFRLSSSFASAPCPNGKSCIWRKTSDHTLHYLDDTGADIQLGGGSAVPLIIPDAASPLGVPLLKVTDNSGANVYFSVSAASTGAAVLDFIDGASAGLSATGHGTLIYDNTLHVFRASLNGGAYAALGGGASFPLTNGTSTTSLNYAGTMTGSSTAYSMDSTNAYTTGDVALNIESAHTSALKIGFNFGAAFPEIQSQTANLLMLNITGDGFAAQGTNFSYWYGAGNTQVEFLANNGMRPVSGFPLYNGTVDAPWSSVGSKWEAAPLGVSLASASTVTPTQWAHPLTGTTTVNTIATTNIPTGTATVVVTETFVCAAACVFGTGGNITTGFTGVTGQAYTFTWDGTAWRAPGFQAGMVTAATLTSGTIPVATGATTIANSSTGNRATMAGILNTAPQAAPGAPSNGDVWYDSSRNSTEGRYNGLTQALDGAMFTSSASATISTATTATLIGTGVGTTTLPAAFCVTGKVVRVHVGGVMTTTATPGNFTFLVLLGGTTIGTTGTFTPGVSLTTKGFSVDARIVFRSCGSSGTVMADGDVEYTSGAGTRGFQDLSNNGSTTTINTTTTLAVDVQLTQAAASQTTVGTVTSIEIVD